ncbi:MAG: hypothetical protein FD147_649 [Chloroflexi bacterium]|nr:MAG: hypothetical protein FD147_649 [Chloroflexota bacterium]MBA4375114.1 hypothetical protein [Anaerolinea sp.]
MTKVFNAVQIGGLALEALGAGAPGKAVGVTSKGIFLNSADKILFLTGAGYKSPFNLQVRQMNDLSNTVVAGDEFTVSDNAILFPLHEIVIDVHRAKLWQPSQPPKNTNSDRTQAERIELILGRMCENDSKKGWLFLGNCGDTDLEPLGSAKDRIKNITTAFMSSFKISDLTYCLDTARSIIGLGGGLTPSGDDWLAGFMLFHARIDQSMGKNNPFFASLGESLTEMSFQKTTKISANRIEAACRGWAEEIFLDAVDYIVAIEKELSETKIKYIMGFGHSSGVDTCMGIFAAWATLKTD